MYSGRGMAIPTLQGMFKAPSRVVRNRVVKYEPSALFRNLFDLCMSVRSVPYKRKKVQKVRNFFRHFRTEILRISAFFLPPKTGVFVSRQKQQTAAVHGALLWYVAEIAEKSWRTQTKDLFFFFLFWRST